MTINNRYSVLALFALSFSANANTSSDLGSCYELARDTGRQIAWARWERGISREDIRTAKVAGHLPDATVARIKGWIEEAYSWSPDDKDIYQWAAELGLVEDLPTTATLTKHETIGIWMRRLARQCRDFSSTQTITE
jgi:hypothetical protein